MNAHVDRRLTGPASWLVFAFGFLMIANGTVAIVRGGATAGDLVVAVLLLGAAALAGAGLRRSARWAWWAALALAALGLFFVLPVAGTILLGGSLEPVGTGWDVVFFPLTAVVLVALLTVLWMLHKRAAAGDGSTSEDS
ncbi:MAG TPA: hypothetical protein VLA09_03030 [Longimicrobiales bacterium]|nr:hypothetical protein [Longimicrobiales bacterium]